MLEQVAFPFSNTVQPISFSSIDSDRVQKSINWFGIILFILFFLAGGFLFFLYKQKHDTKIELEESTDEKQVLPTTPV